MTAELGHYALILCLLAAMVQTILALAGAQGGWPRLMAVGDRAALAQAGAAWVAFALLIAAFLGSDFSVALVAQHSHTEKPWLYKFAGAWGNHEGSMLLWLLILASFGAAIALFGTRLRDDFRARVLSVHGGIGVLFAGFILFTSNPFARLDPAPFEGEGLNPLLQDPGLAFHPPMLYAGYVGLSVAFSFSVAALIEGKVDAAWARWVRPWTLAAWTALTLGIAMGSWWAYYELGWGGWWAWDPVENVSFVPWLMATALIHSVIVVERRESLKSWAVLLAILAFSASLLGTFLVRSGVLTSVHAFASDPGRGLFILIILGIVIGGAFALYAWRAPVMQGGGLFAPVSREGALLANNVVLSVAAGSVLLATLYPLLHETVTGRSLTVGAPVYDMFFPPVMALGLVLLPLGLGLPWKRGGLAQALVPLWRAGVVAFVGGLTVLAYAGLPAWGAALGIAVGLWMLAGTLQDVDRRGRSVMGGLKGYGARLSLLPLSYWGMTLAHLGAGMLVVGVIGASAFTREGAASLKVGETAAIAGFEVTLDRMDASRPVANYTAARAILTIREDGDFVAQLEPERRFYAARRTATTEAAITTNGVRDLYAAIGETEGERLAVRLFVKPFMGFIWGGAILMALGGLVALADRRYRAGAARRAIRPSAVAAAPAE